MVWLNSTKAQEERAILCREFSGGLELGEDRMTHPLPQQRLIDYSTSQPAFVTARLMSGPLVDDTTAGGASR